MITSYVIEVCGLPASFWCYITLTGIYLVHANLNKTQNARTGMSIIFFSICILTIVFFVYGLLY